MGNSGSTPKVSAQDKAILDLKNQRDRLKQYQRRVQTLTDREHALAREALARRDRPRALLALRRKKYQEALLSKAEAQLMQLELLTQDVEFALVQKDVYFGLQQGTAVLKEIQRDMGGIEGVERLVGESEDARRYQHEVAEVIAGKLSNDEEDEVEEELLRLQEASRPAVDHVLEAPPRLDPLPVAPREEPARPRPAQAQQEGSEEPMLA